MDQTRNVPLQPALEPVESDTEENGVDWKRVQLAIDTWRTSKRQPGKGNDMFFDLAFSLKCAGMNFQEIKETLHAEAHHARRPKKRLCQIPSIMNSLRTYSASLRRTGKTQAIAAPLTALASAGTKPESHRKQVGGPSLIGNKGSLRWPRLPASMLRNRLLAACRRASALCRRPVQCPHRRVSRT